MSNRDSSPAAGGDANGDSFHKAPLAEQVRQLRLIIDSLPALVAYVDGHQRYRFTNRRYEEFVGARDPIVGRQVSEVLGARYQEVRGFIERALAGEAVQLEFPWLTEGKEPGRHLSASYVPDVGADGMVRGFVALIVDVTERKRAQDDLRASEELLRTVFEEAPVGMAVVDQEGRPMRSNHAMQRFLGLSRGDLHQTRCVEVTYHEDRDESSRRFAELVAGGRRHYRVEKRYQRPDGSVAWGDTSVTAVTDAAGRFQFAIPVVQDVSERKKAEEALSRSEAHLRHAQKLEGLGQLTAGIAHDFNNLLTVILSNLELASQSVPLELVSLRQELEEAQQAGRRGTELINKLLGFSRRAVVALVPVDLGGLISDVSKFLRRIVPEHITVELCIRELAAVVRADPGAIEQIALNLVTNARDAMPGGGHLYIEVGRTWLDDGYRASHPWVEPGEYVALTVSDTGVGMDARTRERIFDPFFTTKASGEGTGLGMAMVYGLVKEHDGFVDVFSEPGQGTTVRIYFPAVHEAPADHGTHAATQPLRGGTETILVVEDEPSLRRAVQRALESQGYTVLLAADGEEGLDVLRSREGAIDLVMLDLVMPKLGGRQVYDVLRREGRRVKVLFTSGYAAREVEDTAALLPDVPFLHKPWTLTDLFRLVRDALDEEGKSSRGG